MPVDLEQASNLSWRLDPASFGAHLSASEAADIEDDPEWAAQKTSTSIRLYPHTKLLSRKFAEAVSGISPRQIWEIGPRYGKTLVGSNWGPLWYLELFPNKRVILASYGHHLAVRNGRIVRNLARSHAADLTLELAKDSQAADQWNTTSGGGLLAAGAGGAMTGFGGDLIVVDDPLKDWAEAQSETIRNNIWDWYRSVVRTRLHKRGAIIIIACLAGDSPVLMSDGTWKTIAEVRPGDEVATYENGALTSTKVLNWVNQGPDRLYAIRMKSGRTVRANARHPFLVVDESGVETWQRTDMLKPGTSIRSVTGGNGEESSARVAHLRSAPGSKVKGCACRATTSSDGQQGIGPLRSTPSPNGKLTSSTGMESTQPSTVGSWPARTADAQSAVNCRGEADQGDTTSSSASTMTTTPERCEACSAIAATSPSETRGPSKSSSRLLSTYAVTSDEVVEITAVGVEDVFDLQVERTENFIVNGLCGHNTRWHKDDLSGKLKAEDRRRVTEGKPPMWEVVRLPTIADGEARGEPDRLGRRDGEVLCADLFPESEVMDQREDLGPTIHRAMHQQDPADVEGTIFKRDWWRWYDARPEPLSIHQWTMSVDCAFKERHDSSFVVIQCWARVGPDHYLMDQARGRWDYIRTKSEIARMALKWPRTTTHLVEDKANGPAILSDLGRTIAGMVPVEPKGSKVSRAYAVQGIPESGHVYIPVPMLAPWIVEWLDEVADFPDGTADDQVDAMTQYLLNIAGAMAAERRFYARSGNRR